MMQEKAIKAIQREYSSTEGGVVVPTGDRTDCNKPQIIVQLPSPPRRTEPCGPAEAEWRRVCLAEYVELLASSVTAPDWMFPFRKLQSSYLSFG